MFAFVTNKYYVRTEPIVYSILSTIFNGRIEVRPAMQIFAKTLAGKTITLEVRNTCRPARLAMTVTPHHVCRNEAVLVKDLRQRVAYWLIRPRTRIDRTPTRIIHACLQPSLPYVRPNSG